MPACGRYGCSSESACLTWPRWITPSVAVAVNLAQLVARESHSRLSRRKESAVVPADMMAWAMTIAEWQRELRWSATRFMAVRMRGSVLLERTRNSRCSEMGTSPVRTSRKLAIAFSRATALSSTGAACSAAGAAGGAGAAVPSASGSAEATVAATGGGGGGGGLSSCSTERRKDCVQFSTMSKPTWKAISRSSWAPLSRSLLRMSAIATESVSCARQLHSPKKSGRGTER
mmetsp:Transcript_24783/g.57739  ORF Transcript_24783/g.57739 Transcript_24783/m.57739 type:complete len:231 (+) Transcript_24783:2047-2739(+)